MDRHARRRRLQRTITATPGNVLAGTASLTSGSTIVNGSGTAFLTQIVVGVTYTFGSTPYPVASVQSNTQLTLLTEATANASSATIMSGQAAVYAPACARSAATEHFLRRSRSRHTPQIL